MATQCSYVVNSKLTACVLQTSYSVALMALKIHPLPFDFWKQRESNFKHMSLVSLSCSVCVFLCVYYIDGHAIKLLERTTSASQHRDVPYLNIFSLTTPSCSFLTSRLISLRCVEYFMHTNALFLSYWKSHRMCDSVTAFLGGGFIFFLIQAFLK